MSGDFDLSGEIELENVENSDRPQVADDGATWEAKGVTTADPATLEPHPKNADIYGDTETVADLPETFVESIREKGVLEPLVVTGDGRIISGHRRWLAAKHVGLSSVPVRRTAFDSDLAEREALLEYNRQREKKPGQLVNEYEEALEIEKERAKERNSKTAGADPSKETFPDTDKGQARDKAADKIDADVSGRTLEKGKKVKDKADSEDEPEPVREAAKAAWDGLQSGEESFNSAYEEIKQAEREVQEQREREQREETRQSAYQNADETVDIRHGDFRDVLADEPAESVDHIVTDPPYDADALELWAALGAHADRVLKSGGFLVAYSGKAHLPDVHDLLSSHLNYHWQAIVRHAGPGAKIFSRKLRTNYKPVLIYTKGEADLQDDFISDVIEGGGLEKDDHDWQQAESEAAALIEAFTEVNDRICDPMCGSGTIGVAADRLDRQCLLIDADRDHVETARGKVIE